MDDQLSFSERLRNARRAAMGKPVTRSSPKPVFLKPKKTPAEKKLERDERKFMDEQEKFMAKRRNAQGKEKRFKMKDPTEGKIEVKVNRNTTLYLHPDKDIDKIVKMYRGVIERSFSKKG